MLSTLERSYEMGGKMIRSYLRAKREQKRILADDAMYDLLNTDEGAQAFLKRISTECEKSSLIALLEKALEQNGDVVECGVFRGASLRRIAVTVNRLAEERTIYGLDSFEGFPEDGVTIRDASLFRTLGRLKGKFKDAKDAPSRLATFRAKFGINLKLLTGYFEKTLPEISGQQICFLHIDCDTYAGHIEVLESLFDNVVPGGIIVLDDYASKDWPGATQAVDEFLSGRNETVEYSTVRQEPAWYIVKT